MRVERCSFHPSATVFFRMLSSFLLESTPPSWWRGPRQDLYFPPGLGRCPNSALTKVAWLMQPQLHQFYLQDRAGGETLIIWFRHLGATGLPMSSYSSTSSQQRSSTRRNTTVYTLTLTLNSASSHHTPMLHWRHSPCCLPYLFWPVAWNLLGS